MSGLESWVGRPGFLQSSCYEYVCRACGIPRNYGGILTERVHLHLAEELGEVCHVVDGSSEEDNPASPFYIYIYIYDGAVLRVSQIAIQALGLCVNPRLENSPTSLPWEQG